MYLLSFVEKTTSLYLDDGSWDTLENLVFKSDVKKIVPAVFTLELCFYYHASCPE
jgi:hypothetical protein